MEPVTGEISFVPVPSDGGVVNLPAGDWVPVPGGYRRLWGDGVHDDTEAVQAYKVSKAVNVGTPDTGSRTPYLISPAILEAARRAADELT